MGSVSSLLPDLAPLTDSRFLGSFACAAAALPIVGLATWARRDRGPSTTLVAGVSVLLVSTLWFPVPAGLVAGIGLLAAGARVAPRVGSRLLLVAPGACVLATAAGLPGPWWARAFLGGGVWLGASAAPDFDAVAPRAGPVLLAVSAAAACYTVPDTERALVVFGGATALATVGSVVAGQRLGRAGVAVMVGLLAWAVSFGAVARPTAVLGGMASLGLLLTGPIVGHLRRQPHRLRSFAPVRDVGLVLGQLAVDVLTVRVIGRSLTIRGAALRTAVVAAGTAGLAALVARASRRSRVPT
jgi:hypothetical protein